MTNIEAYDANLGARLEELRQKDRAYQLHGTTIIDAVIYSAEMRGEREARNQRLLDCGCGLGFMTKKLTGSFKGTVGIDPSEQAIAIARKEHPGISFYVSSAESFAEEMGALGIEPFDQAILNMVLHSTDDRTTVEILKGVGRCLRPEGTVILIVPTRRWIRRKLIEYAQDTGIEEHAANRWLTAMVSQREIEMPIKISGGEYWPKPIAVQNRTEEDYANFLVEAGFGVAWAECDYDTGREISREYLPCIRLTDYTSSQELFSHHRALLVSFYTQFDPSFFYRAG